MIRPRRHQELFKDWVPSRLRSGKEMRWHQEDDERRNGSTPLALALSSQQLYLEATWIYDSGNTFKFEKGSYPLILEDFAAAIGSYNASSITAVRFDAVGPPTSSVFPCFPGSSSSQSTGLLDILSMTGCTVT